MISRLASRDYKDMLAELGMETLEKRRHRMDMVQVSKIVTGKDNVVTRGLLWHKVPAVIKDARTVTSFIKRLYGAHRDKVTIAD